MDYLEWNDRIAGRFFNGDKSGREVLLYVNKDLIDDIGSTQGADMDDFIEAIKQGPPWAARGEVCHKALRAYMEWRKRGLKYPPYIGYLAFFVLAAGAEGPFAPHAYYPRLWKLLKIPDRHSKQPTSFSRMIWLWDDLEKWSCEDKHEQLGRFTRRIRGSWWKVGLPLSQTLLSDDERKRLPSLFIQADLDPADSPSPELLPGILLYYGNGILERRTLRLIESQGQGDADLKKALTVLVLDELEQWDGSIVQSSPDKKTAKADKRAFLRLCINLDNLSKTARCYLRLKIGGEYPSEELNFKEDGLHTWSCKESTQGWSTRLQDYHNSPPSVYDASKINWSDGFELYDNESRFKAKLRGETIRLFILGRNEGLQDWIETWRLERSAEFLIACHNKDIGRVERWGAESCKSFERRNYSGLPAGWTLFHGKNASSSCEGIDLLTISGTTRLLLKGGIKTGAGNSYLVFAPPRIVLENSMGDEIITINGIKIKSLAGMPIWELPGDSQAGEIINIEANGKNTELRRTIRLENPRLAPSYEKGPCRNRIGRLVERDDKAAVASGAIVNSKGTAAIQPFPFDLPVHLFKRIIFIGQLPGEVSDWPRQDLPSAWNPAWAIVKEGRKKWKAHFCGHKKGLSPVPFPSGNKKVCKKDAKRWKEALWTRRKITRTIGLKPVVKAWLKYLEAARNV